MTSALVNIQFSKKDTTLKELQKTLGVSNFSPENFVFSAK
jgi:hypothetical protein